MYEMQPISPASNTNLLPVAHTHARTEITFKQLKYWQTSTKLTNNLNILLYNQYLMHNKVKISVNIKCNSSSILTTKTEIT